MLPLRPETPEFILASGSPRRLELTRRIGLVPIVRVSSIPEEMGQGESPADYTLRLASEKAAAVAREVEGDEELPGWVLSADTIVVRGDRVLEKPGDADEAAQMLRRLSGVEHEVITSFCWRWRHSPEDEPLMAVRAVRARVWMRDLSDEMIRRYVASGEPMDKAGSYGIQDIGSVLVRRIEGSYFCVVGLPVCEVVETLEELGGLEGYPFPAGDLAGDLAGEGA